MARFIPVFSSIDQAPARRHARNRWRLPVLGVGILYGHIWVTLSLAVRHPCFGAWTLPLRAMLYVRCKTMARIPIRGHARNR